MKSVKQNLIALFLIMAFSLVASSLLGGSSKTANQTAGFVGPAVTFPVGTLVVIIQAVDNNQTTDGDEGAVTSVTDDAAGSTNVWQKAKEFCNGQGSAQAGATCSMWWCQLTTQLTTAHTITLNFSNSASRDASAVIIGAWSVGAGNSVAIEGTPGSLANDGADPGSLNVTTSNIECLRIRGIAGETNSTTALTPTAGWTAMDQRQTSGGSSATNMAVRGEYIISTGTGAASDPTWTAADCASVYVAFKEVASGTTFTQNLSGSTTPAGATKKDVSQKKAGSTTPGGIARLSKITSKLFAGSVSAAGAVAKFASKKIAGSATPSATLVSQRVTLKNLAGSLTPSAIVTKAVSIFRGGSATAAGTVARSIAKKLAGSSTASGALAAGKSLFRTFTGSVTPSAIVARSTSKSLAGNSTPSATVAKADSKKLTGSVTAAGTIAKSAAAVKTGSITSSSSVAFLKLLAKSLARTITASGVVKKAVSIVRAGSVTSAGSIRKDVSIRKAGFLTPSGAVAFLKVALKNLAASVSPSGMLTRSISKRLAGSASPAGAIAKLISIKKTASTAISGAIANLNTPKLNVSGSVTPTGTLKRAVNISLTGTIAIAGELRRSVSKFLGGLIQLAGSVVNQFLGDVIPGDAEMIIARSNRSTLEFMNYGTQIYLTTSSGRSLDVISGAEMQILGPARAEITLEVIG